MKNCLLVNAFILLLCNNAVAQITLNQSGYPVSETGTDSLKVTTTASLFPSLSPVAGGMWDLSAVTDSVPVFFAYRVPGTGYQFADSNMYNFGGFNYNGNLQTSFISGGIFEYSISVMRSVYSISSITSGPTDSFIIPAQNMIYSSPRAKIKFPATYNTAWQSAYSYDLDFQLTYLLEGDTLAPGVVRTYAMEKDSVTGWGKMSVKDAAGSPSVFLNVLQVKTMIVQTDSFYLKGVPVSGPLLLFLNATQGQKDTIYQQNYYRAGEVTPLAQVLFKDAGYTQPYKATTHVQRLQNVDVSQIMTNGTIKAYPNPVKDGRIYLELPDNSGNWNYELVDITGKKILEGNLPAGVNKDCILLPAPLTPGIYYLSVNKDGQQAAVIPVDIQE